MLVPPTGLTKLPTGTFALALLSNTAQLTPSSAFLSRLTSAMIASTSTCGRRMSSLSMMLMIERMIFGGAVMISALVGGSAQIVAFFSALRLRTLPPLRAAPPRLPRLRRCPVICSLSFGAIFSASAKCR